MAAKYRKALTFTVPATSGQYAPERGTFGNGSILLSEDALLGVSALIEAPISPVPVIASFVASASGGTIVTSTVFCVVTSVNANGESSKSAETSAAVTGPNGSITLTITPVANAVTYKAYVGATGAEGQWFSVPVSGVLVITSTTGTAGTPPASTIATGAILELWLLGEGRDPTLDSSYTLSGLSITSGQALWALASFPGAQLRAKSGGTAGTLYVSATAD